MDQKKACKEEAEHHRQIMTSIKCVMTLSARNSQQFPCLMNECASKVGFDVAEFFLKTVKNA